MRSPNGKVYYIKKYGNKLYVGTLQELKHQLEIHFDVEEFDDIESDMNNEAFNFMWQGFKSWIASIGDKKTFKVGIIGVKQLKEVHLYKDLSIGWERMSQEEIEGMGEFDGF